jgi:acyl-CoA thioesterase
MNEQAMVMPPKIEQAVDSLLSEPFVDFLGFREEFINGEAHYLMDFREEHLGNPLIRTFHGGILAAFGEVVAATRLAKQRGDAELPECATMTFDYLRPAFAGTLHATPHIVKAGRRITTVSVQLRLDGKLVCVGRFLFPVGKKNTGGNALCTP